MSVMPPRILTATADSTGAATVVLQDPATSYTITQISVSTNGTTGTAGIFLNGVYVCGTTTGYADSADGPPPIQVNAGDRLTIIWNGAGAGAQCVAQLFGTQTP